MHAPAPRPCSATAAWEGPSFPAIGTRPRSLRSQATPNSFQNQQGEERVETDGIDITQAPRAATNNLVLGCTGAAATSPADLPGHLAQADHRPSSSPRPHASRHRSIDQAHHSIVLQVVGDLCPASFNEEKA